MLKNLLIIALVLLLLYLVYQQKKLSEAEQEIKVCRQDLKTLSLEKLKFLQAKEATKETIDQARKLFWQLRVAAGEWTRFKEPQAIKELVESMRKNPIFEEQLP